MSGERRNEDSPTGWSRWDAELGKDVWVMEPGSKPTLPLTPAPKSKPITEQLFDLIRPVE